MINTLATQPSVMGMLLNAAAIIVMAHILTTSLVWICKHKSNGWAYSMLPALASAYALAFQVASLSNKLFALGLDPILLNYISQVSSLLVGISYAIALRLHLHWVRRAGG